MAGITSVLTRLALPAVVATGWFFGPNALPSAPAATPAALLAYHMEPGHTVRYQMKAVVNGSLPLFESKTPVKLEAVLTLVYQATPRTLLADGTSDVDFKVESAEIEIAKVPFPIPDDQVQKALDQTVTFSKTGQVVKLSGGGKLPSSVSIPGLDPGRLYALIYPIVFQPAPVSTGDTWTFKSELISGVHAHPTFRATVLSVPEGDGATGVTRIGEKFYMPVDQTLNVDRKPVATGDKPYKSRKGSIFGSGTLQFDNEKGLFTRSVVDVKARLLEKLLGKKLTPDDPVTVASTVDATVTVDLLPPAPVEPAATVPTPVTKPQ